MKDTIFKSKTEMPGVPVPGRFGVFTTPDVVRTAQNVAEMEYDHRPALSPQNRNVQHVVRPRRGHGY